VLSDPRPDLGGELLARLLEAPELVEGEDQAHSVAAHRLSSDADLREDREVVEPATSRSTASRSRGSPAFDRNSRVMT
jgi:hypothetical protein